MKTIISSKIKINTINLLYFGIVITYSFVIAMAITNYAINDDVAFKNAANQNKILGPAITFSHQGRMILLHGIDMFILNKISKDNFLLFYSFSGLTFLFCGIFLKNILPKKISIGAYIWLVALIGSLCTTSIFFRLMYQERYILLAFLLLTYVVVKMQKGIWQIICIFLLSNFIIHSKEAGIAAMFCLGVGFIIKSIFRVKSINKYNLVLGMIPILSSIFAIIYYLINIFPNIEHRYGENNASYFSYIPFNLAKWIVNEPFIFLGFVPLLFYRIYEIVKRRQDIHIYDLLGFAGFGYIVTFFILKICHSDYYMSPVYGIAIPFVFFWVYTKHWYYYRRYTVILVLFCILQVSNVQLGVTDIIFQRFNNKNLYTILGEIKEKDIKKLTIIGNQNNLQEIPTVDYFNFFLNDRNFEINTTEYFNSFKKGDFILQTPWSRKDFVASDHFSLIQEFSAPHIVAKENLNYLISCYLAKIPGSDTNIADRMYVRDATYRLYRYH